LLCVLGRIVVLFQGRPPNAAPSLDAAALAGVCRGGRREVLAAHIHVAALNGGVENAGLRALQASAGAQLAGGSLECSLSNP